MVKRENFELNYIKILKESVFFVLLNYIKDRYILILLQMLIDKYWFETYYQIGKRSFIDKNIIEKCEVNSINFKRQMI
jgi:hypothetical protein